MSMNDLTLFLPCGAGIEPYLTEEVGRILGPETAARLYTRRGGVELNGSWRDMLQLNLHSRLAQRVLVRLSARPYRSEQDIYDAAMEQAWEIWLTARQTLKIDITAQHSPLKSLNFAALKVKDAVCDRLRQRTGSRPSIDTARPDVRVFVHLTPDTCHLYIDTSGEPLFKRGWRQDTGDAPLKETLAAAMLEASGWQPGIPLYDPCCGSGTILIEAAQRALGIAPGAIRRFGFEHLLPFQSHVWAGLKAEARSAVAAAHTLPIFGSDVAFRMVDFARQNAQRAGVGQVIQWRGGDALQRMPPCDTPGILLLNPPYGERIAAAGLAGQKAAGRAARESARDGSGAENSTFFAELASHWKRHYTGWTAWMLTPDLKLPGKMRLKENRRIPFWNGPIECRLFRFELQAGSLRGPRATPSGTEAV